MNSSPHPRLLVLLLLFLCGLLFLGGLLVRLLLCVCLSRTLSPSLLCACPPLSLSPSRILLLLSLLVTLFCVCVSLCLCVCLSRCLCVCLSRCLCVCVSRCLCVCVSLCLCASLLLLLVCLLVTLLPVYISLAERRDYTPTLCLALWHMLGHGCLAAICWATSAQRTHTHTCITYIYIYIYIGVTRKRRCTYRPSVIY